MAGNKSHSRRPVPTVSELLESPSIRALAERWNRSSVAAGLRSFVEELRTDLLRRGDRGNWPTPRELAERAARHILAMQETSVRPAINATGQFWSGPWAGLPQSEVALEHAYAIGREFVMDGNIDAVTSIYRAGDAETIVCRRTGAEAAAIVHSYSAALWLAIAATAPGREVLITRGDVADVEPGCTMDSLVASAGALLREVGSVNRSTIADFEATLTEQSAVLLSVHNAEYQVVGNHITTTREERVTLARDRELVAIEAIGISPLVEIAAAADSDGGSKYECAQQLLYDGVQLVIARGDGFVGGPPCGVIAGAARQVEKIKRHPMYAALQLDPSRKVALATALKLAGSTSTTDGKTPIADLMTTPIGNLRHRAERLATQLAPAAGIAAAEPISLGSPITALAKTPSFGVTLRPTDGDATKLANRLANAPLPIIVRVDNGSVVIDLRTVFPRHDAAITEAIVGPRGEFASPAENVGVEYAATNLAE